MEYRILEQLDEIKSILIEKKTDKWMKINNVCDYASLSESTIRRNVKRGALKASTSTGRLLFKKSDVDKWLTR
jgi:excisionase family DNA binding protein